MSTSISAAATVKSNSGDFDSSKAASQIASKMMRELDTDKSGTIDKKEFVNGLVAKGSSADTASQQFDAIDSKKAGAIDRTDIESALQGGQLKPSAGARPAQGTGAGGAGAAGSSSTQTYDPADTNEDGKVSLQESLIYDLSQAAKKISMTSTDTSLLGSNVDEKV